MILNLRECENHMKKEEKGIYESKTATEYFRYIYQSEKFQEIIKKMKPEVQINEEEWKYIFEKLYLVTYKSMSEESTPNIIDGLMYLISKIGIKVFPKDSPNYNEYYKNFEMIRSLYRTRSVNDDLLANLSQVMQSKDTSELEVLLREHEEVSLLRNNRDYMYRESLKSSDGVITNGERTAINCFNRSYEKAKEYRLIYKNLK